MRILLVSDFYPPILGGISTQVDSLAKALIERGHKVFVYAVSGPSNLTRSGGLTIVEAEHISSSFFPFLFNDKREKNIPPIPDPVFIKGLNRVVKSFQPDAIHAHGWVMFPTASCLGNLKVSVATMHDYGFLCSKRDLIPRPAKSENDNNLVCKRIKVGSECLICSRQSYGYVKSLAVAPLLKLFQHLPKKYDFLTAVSNYVADKASLVLQKNVVSVPNFIDPEQILQESDKTSLKPDNVDVLFVGRLSRQKGVPLLLDAIQLLQKRGVIPKVTIVGKRDPSFSANLDNPSVTSITYRENISRSEVLGLYRQCKVVVIPSIWADPQPMVALESMAFSKPLIATKVGGLQEMVRNNRTGLLVEPESFALSDAIQFVLTHPSIAKEMGAKANALMVEKYVPKVVIPLFERMYNRTTY